MRNKEKWRLIPGLPKNYQVSNLGRLRKDNKLVKLKANDGGYYSFSCKGFKTKRLIHRCVLLAFDRAPNEGEVCRHLNDVKDDNRLENLKWGSHKENSADAKRNNSAVGRPLRGETPSTHSVTFRLDSREKRTLQDYCLAYDLSITDAVRWALDIVNVVPQNPSN